jgi:hypothetical protein
MKKYILGLIMCGVVFSMNASVLSKPEACPTVEMLKQVGVKHFLANGNVWIAWNKDKFNTKHAWFFATSILNASSGDEAAYQIKAVLNDMQPVEDNIPKPSSEGGWECKYLNMTTYDAAISITPAPIMQEVFRKLRLGYHPSV